MPFNQTDWSKLYDEQRQAKPLGRIEIDIHRWLERIADEQDLLKSKNPNNPNAIRGGKLNAIRWLVEQYKAGNIRQTDDSF